MDHLKLTVDKLSVEAINDLVLDDSCGAVSMFVGTTRDNFEGKKVLRLEYEAYEPMALKAMKSICDEVRNKWPAVYSIALYHRLGNVPCREASVVIAVSSPHRAESLAAVGHIIERLKASVPIWKREVYATAAPQWKENTECVIEPSSNSSPSPPPQQTGSEQILDKNLIQINVSSEELQQRIQNFIERKREQVNVNNIRDFIPTKGENETEETETCARVRTQFVRRSDSKGHLKIRKVNNEWGPQTVTRREFSQDLPSAGLPPSIAERVLAVEDYLNIKSVSRDVFKRLKDIEDKIAYLQSVSPEYAQFWKNNSVKDEEKEQHSMDYTFSADDIARKIELLEKQAS
ncbi:molybdopterin synthase catalytic subunit [Ostrinia furnacalis]|uniref:molybdopterin synthase catalytic subunit n=1 Tax=Ostrinia furnacalis TaxID=93504 RepID=UPI00103C1BE8|nr:molybdopterin synthase catalytic subunit [Ostrinia furnacalis]XP_028168703.1 molybdopterin synthase catalytic subunit [Ostrinia furnacalis]